MTEDTKGGTRIQTFAEFWPYYLREHAKPLTRAFHFAGTGLATAMLLAALVTFEPWLVVLALLLGYGPAWAGHFFIEKNQPATFRYPLWSLAGDYRMAWFWITGRLPHELAAAGVR